MASLILLIAGVIVSCILSLLYLQYQQNRGLPPGPRRLPFIGNLHQAPTDNPWRTYQQWSKRYGPVFSLQYGLSTIIMLGNHDAARDLLDKKSNIYSSRPRVVMGGEVVSRGLRTLLMPYGPRWRTHQRLQGSFLNIRSSETYKILQDVESKQLISEMLSTSDFADRFHRYSSSLIFCLAYGRRLTRGDEEEAKSIDRVMENFTYAARVGTWIVDALPFLNYLPAFVAPWKRYGAKLHAFEAELFQKNLDSAEESRSWNWAKQVRSMKESQDMSDLEVAYDLGVIYEAGSDTTTMAMEVFVMAAVLFPAVVAKAQRELDSVVGDTRLPTFEDRDDLPYVQAIVKEVLRWRPVSAGGIPHATTQEDHYWGYRIPKGATVIGNHWSIHLDEDLYQDPHSFKPERWIKTPDLPLHAFGFGRRVCTGQHIAKNSLFINISRLLWGFSIEHAYEERDGQKVRCEVDSLAMTQGFNSRPMPFKASFRLRSLNARNVITSSWTAAEKDADVLLKKIRQDQGNENV